jgi:hypothetical protein
MFVFQMETGKALAWLKSSGSRGQQAARMEKFFFPYCD